jgi:hypothetical protein
VDVGGDLIVNKAAENGYARAYSGLYVTEL